MYCVNLVILNEGGGKTFPAQRHLASAAVVKDLVVAHSWLEPREMLHSGGGTGDRGWNVYARRLHSA